MSNNKVSNLRELTVIIVLPLALVYTTLVIAYYIVS